MVQHLRQHPALYRLLHLACRVGEQPGEGIRRRVDGRAALPLQPGQLLQMAAGALVEGGASGPGLPVGPPQQHGCRPVFQASEKAVVGNAVLYLPPGQDHAHIRRQIKGVVAADAHPALAGVHHAASAAGGVLSI